MELIEIFKYSSECWYPSYFLEGFNGKDTLVKVRFSELRSHENNKTEWRVSVWGNDDFGMERDFLGEQKEDAIKCFHKIVELKDVTKQALLDLGFCQA